MQLQNTYAEQLANAVLPAQVERWPDPEVLLINDSLAQALGLDLEYLHSPAGTEFLTGQALPDSAQPVAQAYAGHQFGNFSPQLGDGRALLAGEVVDEHGQRWDLAFKGSGRTPFSRGGDGLAALGPVLREYIMGEAMHALGIPSTRILAAVSTGMKVLRDQPLPGAMLLRAASSHLRVGTFQFFASRGDIAMLNHLVRYTVDRHFPGIRGSDEPALELLAAVAERQAHLVAQWMSVGFIHGVMNTDNMAISGQTLDFGPCAFMDEFDLGTVFSSIDHHGRYAYGQQPGIASWNLSRFAEALLPVIEGDPDDAVTRATNVLEGFADQFQGAWNRVLQRKFGLSDEVDLADVEALAHDWLGIMRQQGADFTLSFRSLQGALTDASALRLTGDDAAAWHTRWLALGPQADLLARHNPLYLPRNHMVEEALSRAEATGDLSGVHGLLKAVTDPFTERPGLERYSEPAPAGFTAGHRTFCGT